MKGISQILILSILCVAVIHAQQKTTASTPPPNPNESDLLAIIRNQNLQKEDPEKLTNAIESLGNMRSINAIDDLLPLLSFSRTYPWESTTSSIRIHPVTVAGRYPAVGALMQIGRPAVPSLLRTIVEKNSTELIRKNATDALMLIYREDRIEGIKVFRNAIEQSKTPESAAQLRQASTEALGWCLPSERATCETLLKQPDDATNRR